MVIATVAGAVVAAAAAAATAVASRCWDRGQRLYLSRRVWSSIADCLLHWYHNWRMHWRWKESLSVLRRFRSLVIHWPLGIASPGGSSSSLLRCSFGSPLLYLHLYLPCSVLLLNALFTYPISAINWALFYSLQYLQSPIIAMLDAVFKHSSLGLPLSRESSLQSRRDN